MQRKAQWVLAAGMAAAAFLAGTAAEVTPVASVDDIEIGVGPVTQAVQKAYLDTVNGRDDRWGDWLDVVDKLVTEALARPIRPRLKVARQRAVAALQTPHSLCAAALILPSCVS